MVSIHVREGESTAEDQMDVAVSEKKASSYLTTEPGRWHLPLNNGAVVTERSPLHLHHHQPPSPNMFSLSSAPKT